MTSAARALLLGQVRAQLKHRFGRCWEASYSSAVRNDATTLQLRSD